MAQAEYQFTTVCQARYDAVADLVGRFGSIDIWAKGVVDSCVSENTLSFSEVGSARRCVLKNGCIWRDTLTGMSSGSCQTFVTSRLTTALEHENRKPSLVETRDAFMQELAGECVIMPQKSAAQGLPIVDAVCTLSVTPLSTHPLRCVLRFYCTYECPTDSEAEARAFFDTRFGRPQVEALANFALGSEFPGCEGPPGRTPLHDLAEDTLAAVATSSVADQFAVAFQQIVDAYGSVYNDWRQQETQNEALREELQARNQIIDALSAEAAALQATCREAEHRALLASHALGTCESRPAVCCADASAQAESLANVAAPPTLAPAVVDTCAAPSPPPSAAPLTIPYLDSTLSARSVAERFAIEAIDGVIPVDTVNKLFAEQVASSAFDFESVAKERIDETARQNAKRWYDKAFRGRVKPLNEEEFGMLLAHLATR